MVHELITEGGFFVRHCCIWLDLFLCRGENKNAVVTSLRFIHVFIFYYTGQGCSGSGAYPGTMSVRQKHCVDGTLVRVHAQLFTPIGNLA